MKKQIATLFFIMILCLPAVLYAETLPSIVPASWLNENLKNPALVILDIRRVEHYKEGHVPGALSLTYAAWRTMEKNLDCELPHKDDLSDTICSSGIQADAHVVIVGNTDTELQLMNATRVAWTLKYAGVKHPAILDGGFKKWVSSKYPVSEDWVRRPKTDHKCTWNENVLATKKYIESHLGKVTIVDTRSESLYRGEKSDPMLKRKGHIRGAVNLPYSLVFTKDGTFEDTAKLKALASKAVGDVKDKGIVLLCCNGQFASSWWFALSEVLRYRDVKIYDGSMEEWCRDPEAPLVESTGDR